MICDVRMNVCGLLYITLHSKWGKEMNEAVEALRSDLVQEVDTYISGSLKHWVIEEVRPYNKSLRARVF